jgi:ketosteroid isomerase-like protein
MLVLLESLSPEQRAAFLLHDVFDYGYEDIARIVGKNEDNVRQLATRARRHVAQRRPRFQTSQEQRDELARRFFAAAQAGDLAGLEALLARDVVLTGDGGGKVPTLARSVRGRRLVAGRLLDWTKRLARLPGVSIRFAEVNAGPGALVLDGHPTNRPIRHTARFRRQTPRNSSIRNPVMARRSCSSSPACRPCSLVVP